MIDPEINLVNIRDIEFCGNSRKTSGN